MQKDPTGRRCCYAGAQAYPDPCPWHGPQIVSEGKLVDFEPYGPELVAPREPQRETWLSRRTARQAFLSGLAVGVGLLVMLWFVLAFFVAVMAG